MRKTTMMSLMAIAALGLVACSGSGSSSSEEAAAAAKAKAAIPSEVSGTIVIRGSIQPSDKATLVLNLVDVSASAAGTAPLASKTAPAGTFPQPFTLKFNPAQIKPNDLYVVRAILTDGERHYAMPMQAPVLTNGSKSEGVTIQLVAEQTPGEKLLEQFQAEQKQLGAMKISHGTKLEKDDSRGWQVFRQADQLKFIREDVDYVDGGYTRTDYAFKDGKVWAIEQQNKTGRNGETKSIDRAGWDENGKLVLKQHQVGKDVQVLDAEQAAKMKTQAAEILSLATKGKNK